MKKNKIILYNLIFLALINIGLMSKVYAQKNDSNIVINTFVPEMRERKPFKTYYTKRAIPKSLKKKLKAIDKEISFSNPGDNYIFTDLFSWRDRFHKKRVLINVIKSDKIVIINYYLKGVKFGRNYQTIISLYDKQDALIFVLRAVFRDAFELYNCIMSNNYDIRELKPKERLHY